MQKFTIRLLVGGFLLFSACKTVPPQITRFEAPTSIVRGEKAVLVWDVLPTKTLQNIVLTNIADSLPIQGKAEVKPYKTTQYELRIQYKHKRKQSLSDSRKVSVAVTEPKVSFTGVSKINIGDEAVLSWELPHFAQNVRLSEWVDGEIKEDWEDMPSHASYQVKPVKNAVYKIEYLDEGIAKVLEHAIEVTPAFFTGTKKVLAGEEIQLIWKTNPSTPHVSLEKRENSYTREVLKEHLPTSGSYKTVPTHTTEYLLSIIDEHHTTLIHKVDVVMGIIAGQKIVKQGEKAFLSWRATPLAKKVWIETVENKEPVVLYKNLAEEGQIEVAPQANTTYLLAVETAEGIARYEHTMRVTAPNEGGIYTQASPDAQRYNVAHDPQHHHKGLSTLDDSPVTIEPHQILDSPTKIKFDFDKSEVAPEHTASLDALVAKLKKEENAIAEIAGHADLKGTTKGCDKISSDRAESVKKYLVQAGIPEYRIMTRAYGRMFPVNYKETDDTLAKENRRVEVIVLK